jgi:translation initiation factor IF-2
MKKKKVFQVAKELGVSHKDILGFCKKLKIKAKGVNTPLTEEQCSQIVTYHSKLNSASTGVSSAGTSPTSSSESVSSSSPTESQSVDASTAQNSNEQSSETTSKPRSTKVAKSTSTKSSKSASAKSTGSDDDQDKAQKRKIKRSKPSQVTATISERPQVYQGKKTGVKHTMSQKEAALDAEANHLEIETAVDTSETPVSKSKEIDSDSTSDSNKSSESKESTETKASSDSIDTTPSAEEKTEVQETVSDPQNAESKSSKGSAEPKKKEVYVAKTSKTAKSTNKSSVGRLQAQMTGRSISLDQLKARTGRPARGNANRNPRRSHTNGPDQGKTRSPRGDKSSGPGRPRSQGNPNSGSPINVNEIVLPPPMPGDAKDQRRRPKPKTTEESTERTRNQRNVSRRRQEIYQNDLYRSAGGRNSYRNRRRKRKGAKPILTTPAAHKRVVRVDETISVGELGKSMGVKSADIIRKLMDLGMMVTINQQIDFDTVCLVVADYNYEAKNVAFDEQTLLSGPEAETKKEEDPNAVLRAPVITIMGHVDHGKTTLLDSIRSSNVVSGEAGGITQHIGAYKIETPSGPVVFLDTPGHAAFSAMRARGASVTDLIVLVVAADDGIMPQTIESINHARAANVPLIVAVNKIDKHGVDPDRIRQELTAYEIVPEEWGGETMFVNISALRGDGVDELLESLALQAEILELKANPKKPAYGRVVEARIDKGRGTVVTVLVQEGQLKQSDYMLVGKHYGRIRSLNNHLGKKIKTAGPSTPVEITGLNGVPSAGEEFFLVKNERDAKRIVSSREIKAQEHKRSSAPAPPSDPWNVVEKQTQNLIIKADVSGSLEAIKASLNALGTDEVEVNILSAAVGQITESDVMLAQTANANVIGFNVGPDSKAKRLAEQAGTFVERYSIIYELLDAVKDLMSGLLAPEIIEERIGRVEVRQVFHIQKVGSIAGSFVLDGKVNRNASARIMRDGEQIFEGKISTLKRFKDDVREVSNGYECGIAVEGYKDIQEGDVLEVIEYTEIRRSID